MKLKEAANPENDLPRMVDGAVNGIEVAPRVTRATRPRVGNPGAPGHTPLAAAGATRLAELGRRGDQETLSRLESGKHSIQPRTLDKIAKVLEHEHRRIDGNGRSRNGRT